MTIIKNGDASTLDVVSRVKAALPEIKKAAPPGMNIDLMFDQSVFVQNSIESVLQEGAIAAGLTALMILIFLGSWRSTIVVMVSIPLSILTSIAVLSALGQTINTMTLGGLALAVGILVDDSTVTIENTHRLLEERRPFDQAVLEGAAGIAVPTSESRRSPFAACSSRCFSCRARRAICSHPAGDGRGIRRHARVLLPFAHIDPDHDRVVESRTEHERHGVETGWFARFHTGFNAKFDRFRDFYGWLLGGMLRRPIAMSTIALLVVIGAGVLSLNVGSDFFPSVDAGEFLIQLHVSGAGAHPH